jgi:hypothetical protein
VVGVVGVEPVELVVAVVAVVVGDKIAVVVAVRVAEAGVKS